MKYIRTKDGIEKLDDEWALFCKEHANNKQADDIVELCDVLCYKQKGSYLLPRIFFEEPSVMLKDESWKKAFIREIGKGTIYYGAIWTDKGLIYIAKMNDKGELELI